MADSTALGWFDNTLQQWQVYGDLSTAADLLRLAISGSAADYQTWAEDYYEHAIDLQALQRIFALTPLDNATVQALNPELTFLDLAADLAEIAFPIVP